MGVAIKGVIPITVKMVSQRQKIRLQWRSWVKTKYSGFKIPLSKHGF